MNKVLTAIKIIKTYGLKDFIVILTNKIFNPPHQYKQMKDFKEIEKYFIKKSGLEIGGPSSIFERNGFMPIYDKISNLDGVNFCSSTIWTGTIDKEKGFIIDGKRVGKQYILDAVDLTPIDKDTYDFVLSSNNIEHIANPMRAIEQWLLVLKRGGILVIVAPRKDSNFDHNREIVTFDHLISDYQNEYKEDDLTHLEEILVLHDLKMDIHAGTIEQVKERSLNNFDNRCLHHHVFDLNVLRKICEHFNLSMINNIQLDRDYVIVAQK